MGTWIQLNIKTDDKYQIIEALGALIGTQEFFTSKFPADFYDSFLMDSSLPYYLLVAQTQVGWITVLYNSLNKLEEWCKMLSLNFNTRIILTQAQNNADYYYFALYEYGELKRHIEVCYGEDFEPIDYGAKFSFEKEFPAVKSELLGDVEYTFDYDSIITYSKKLGLNNQIDYSQNEWTVVKGLKAGRTRNDILTTTEKPWWKFW